MKHPARFADHTAPAEAGAVAQSGFGTAFIGLCRRPLLWAGLAVCLLAGYAPALFGGVAVGIDDLAIDIYQQEGEFLRQNRVTEWLVQAATGLLTCQPFWPEFWAGVCLALAGVLLAALLYAAAGQTPGTGGTLLLAGGLMLFPYHAEAFSYTNLCLTGFGILLCVLALLACRRHLVGGWRRGGVPGAVGAAVLLAFALGCYESMAQVWLTLMFAFLLTAAQGMPAQSRRAWWAVPAMLRGLWPFAAGLLLRGGLTAALRAALGITGENGTASTTIYWFRRESVDAAVKIFLHQAISFYITRAYMVPAAALLLGACVLLALWVGVPLARQRQLAVRVRAVGQPVCAGYLAGHRQPEGAHLPMLCAVRALCGMAVAARCTARRAHRLAPPGGVGGHAAHRRPARRGGGRPQPRLCGGSRPLAI